MYQLNVFICRFHKLNSNWLKSKSYILFHIIKKYGKTPEKGLFLQFMTSSGLELYFCTVPLALSYSLCLLFLRIKKWAPPNPQLRFFFTGFFPFTTPLNFKFPSDSNAWEPIFWLPKKIETHLSMGLWKMGWFIQTTQWRPVWCRLCRQPQCPILSIVFPQISCFILKSYLDVPCIMTTWYKMEDPLFISIAMSINNLPRKWKEEDSKGHKRENSRERRKESFFRGKATERRNQLPPKI